MFPVGKNSADICFIGNKEIGPFEAPTVSGGWCCFFGMQNHFSSLRRLIYRSHSNKKYSDEVLSMRIT